MSLYIHIEWIWKVPLFSPLITHGNGNFLNQKFIVECVLWITSLFICNWQWYHSLRWLLLLVIKHLLICRGTRDGPLFLYTWLIVYVANFEYLSFCLVICAFHYTYLPTNFTMSASIMYRSGHIY